MPIISGNYLVLTGDVFTLTSAEPIFVLEETGTLVNTSTSFGDTGIQVSGTFDATFLINGNIITNGGVGIWLVNSGGTVTIGETGTIDSNGDGAIVQYTSSTIASQIYNHGTLISNDIGYTVSLSAVADTVVNTGLIANETGAGNNAVATHAGADRVTNQGMIIGDVDLGAGNDRFDGRGGTVDGTIEGGADNDTFLIDDPQSVIDGGTGNDTVYSWTDVLDTTNVEEITLRGDANATAIGDDNTVDMNGNAGDNAMYGSALNNNIKGFGGDDELYGFAGADTIRGNTGNDFIDGGADDDVLFGGTGDDTITGGTGADVMRGEQGADTFVWNGINESGIGGARDVVVGFERGTDTLDLSGIDDTSFTFRGTNAFTGGGDMEVRYRVQAAGHSIVELDSNGDGIVDAEIQVRGVTVLNANDFVL